MRRILSRSRRRNTRKPVAAPLRLAFLASSVDALVVLAVVEVFNRVTGAPSLWTREPGDVPLWEWQETAVTLSVSAAAVACDVLAEGRTPGRAAAGIRLERDSGRLLDPRTAVIRQFAALGSNMVVGIPARMLLRAGAARRPEDERRVAARAWALAAAIAVARLTARAADPWKRSLEDRIAGTRLVRSRPRQRLWIP